MAVGGAGGDGSTNGCSPDYAGTPGGGGGGGYYGGGGGGGGAGGGGGSGGGGGGGGGVSYIGGVTSATTADGVQAGDGMVALCYDTPSIATVQPVPTLGQSLLALLGLALAGLAMLRVRRQG
ncbi:hypothetical protein [Ottowia sp.]|uniref:hypothetical protein n=1 Tax=Ottowia sp. TaxID=1898956 RepID=UPI00261FC482|nr:hypothetical protein [Ottowia sp.]